ncbi:mRNA (guanine-N(7))-methyltransferase [Plasmodiophora brassicae]|uniref:mRNA (guanine-N(7))-methyltransferase n=1 Tax=Plasmodiophora brassicae TaxID=37360 RepID=A0A0G4IM51_PLABS|nr:hypothetical protein PBRA_004857 [Plasmodiophora brassicae]
MSSAQDIANHYDAAALAKHGRHMRSASDAVQLRRLNNWIKTVQINMFVSEGDCVLDLCSGKGGDLGKYLKRRIGYYVGCDVSLASAKEAIERYNQSTPGFGATLVVTDCFATNLDDVLPEAIQFDAVSCQFSLHYSFETEARARRMIENVSRRLKPGGHFYGTCPDANVIVDRMRAAYRDDPSATSFGNDYFQVTVGRPGAFDYGQLKKSQGPFGHRYVFDLTDAINSCGEWLVPVRTLISLADSAGLDVVSIMNLHQFFTTYSSASKHPDFADLLRSMRVLDARRRIPEQQFEVAGLYIAFCFKKRGRAPAQSEPFRRPFHHLEAGDIIRI